MEKMSLTPTEIVEVLYYQLNYVHTDILKNIAATNSSLTTRIDILEKSIENLKVQKATPVPTYIVNNNNITPPSVAPKVNNEWTVVSRGSASNAKSPLKNFDLPLVNRYEPLTRQSEDTRHSSLYHSDCYNINFIDGDIYEAPKEYSYVQCVSQDLHCGAGIAAQFKAKYGGIDYMKAQNKTVCDIAVLPIEDERYLFNLITKLKYFHKPTLNSIERCLWQLKHLCHEFGVRKIAMPLIACGLDKQPWTQVQKILEKVMGHSIIDVLVYTSKETHTEWPPISFTQTQQVHNKSKKQKSPQSDSKNDPINPTNPTKKSPTRPSEQNKDKQKNKNGLHEKMRNSSTTTQSTTTTATVLTQTTTTNKPLIQTTQSDIALPTTQPIILIPTSTIINPLTTTTLSTTVTTNTTLLNATTQLTTSIPSTTQSTTVIPTTTINESITKTTQSTSVTPTTTLFTPTTQLTTLIPCTTQSTTEIPTTTIKKSTTKTTHSTSVTPATTLFTTTTQPTIIIPSTNQSTAVTPTTSMTMPPLKTTESTTETPMSTHSTIVTPSSTEMKPATPTALTTAVSTATSQLEARIYETSANYTEGAPRRTFAPAASPVVEPPSHGASSGGATPGEFLLPEISDTLSPHISPLFRTDAEPMHLHHSSMDVTIEASEAVPVINLDDSSDRLLSLLEKETDCEISEISPSGKENGCCKENSTSSEGYDGVREITDQLVNKMKFTPYDASQEAIFPSELQISDALDTQQLVFRGEMVTWHRPLDLTELLELKAKHPDARLVMGNTEVGLEMKFKQCVYPVLIQPSLVRELSEVRIVLGQGVTFGAAVTLSEVETQLRQQVEQQPRHVTRVFSSVLDMLHWFAGKQIRNVGTLGGNIMTSSPISDLNPIFLAANCELKAQSKLDGVRAVCMDHEFFTSYRRNALKPHEVLVSISIPYSSEHQYFAAFKQAKRREDDIAIVNAAFNVHLRPGSDVVTFAALAFGGMAPTTVLAKRTAQMLIGRHWNEETLQLALDSLASEMTLDPGAPGGVVRYRRSLTLGFFFKFFLMVQQERGVSLQARDVSATSPYHSALPAGSQYFEKVPDGQASHDLVGRPIPHLAGMKHTTGEAVYCDDMPCASDELFLALVTSTRAHARLLSVDASQALALSGVEAFFSAKDLDPDRNRYGLFFQDEEVFAAEKVLAQGQIIGAVVAKSREIAQRAAKLVHIEYEDLKPLILSIEDAIREESFFKLPYEHILTRGDATNRLEQSEVCLEGEVRMGGQEHFYLETNCTRAVPSREDEEMTIFCATQSPTSLQGNIAKILGVPHNRVRCHVRRLGGGFGGKESRFMLVAAPVALAAQRLRRPVRCMLDRDEDMMITGGRNPYLGRYKVGFSRDGQIHALSADLYSNAGSTLDYSAFVMNRALYIVTNSYDINDLFLRGYVCRTNLPSNTAMRGFGSPQALFIGEMIVEDVAAELGMDPALVRARNLLKEGDVTCFGQKLVNCTLRRCWDECEANSDYATRKELVQQFNKEHRWKKRGISMTPLTFGCGFDHPFPNQAGALIHIYTDGSVLLTHGGVEMGQGLHTKIAQVASRALGVPEVDVHITETRTDTVPNTIDTAASVSSDLNGMAIIDACNKLLNRLKPYREANPKGEWKDWVKAAHYDRVSLSATGFYKLPLGGYDWMTSTGTGVFNYYSFGVACSEVEIDCLTGDHQILRTDIVMDLGESLNPAIDVGQVEGAFLQGVGLLTTEELLYSPEGVMLTRGPSTYKIPGFSDAPARFNVTLLRGSSNPRAVYSSKAVGEPPLLLATSVFCAIKGAIAAAREDAGLSGRFRLDSPATSACIRLACADQFMEKIPSDPEPGKFTPWNIDI